MSNKDAERVHDEFGVDWSWKEQFLCRMLSWDAIRASLAKLCSN